MAYLESTSQYSGTEGRFCTSTQNSEVSLGHLIFSRSYVFGLGERCCLASTSPRKPTRTGRGSSLAVEMSVRSSTKETCTRERKLLLAAMKYFLLSFLLVVLISVLFDSIKCCKYFEELFFFFVFVLLKYIRITIFRDLKSLLLLFFLSFTKQKN